MKFYHFKIDNIAPIDVIRAFHDDSYSLFFDSAREDHPDNCYSYVLFHPVETLDYHNNVCNVTTREEKIAYENECPFNILKDRLDIHHKEYFAPKSLAPFHGGAAGLFGYDLARVLEQFNRHGKTPRKTPDMAIGIYNQLFAYDHKKQQGWFYIHADNKSIATRKFYFFENAVQHSDHKTLNTPSETIERNDWILSHSKDEYIADTKAIIDYIFAGDIFQANLSQRFSAKLPEHFSPFDHYKCLREANAAPFAAYMNFGTFRISSSSPERFIQIDSNNQVETKPIKGTIKRAKNQLEDKDLKTTLLQSVKDNAENAMIVDLMRNDLSKACIDSSIDVPKLCEIESFAEVHHLVSTITGQIRPDKHAVDLLKSCFPGGSVTGAPKVRAMEIINEFEKDQRGPYCGSLGLIGYNGMMDTNIAIRTLVYEDGHVHFNVGGGIVADSDPAKEHQETLDKASAIFNSFEIYNNMVKDKRTDHKSSIRKVASQ